MNTCHQDLCNNFVTYDFSLWDIIEHDEITEHSDEADESQTRDYVDNSILQTKLSWNKKSLYVKQPPLILNKDRPKFHNLSVMEFDND